MAIESRLIMLLNAVEKDPDFCDYCPINDFCKKTIDRIRKEGYTINCADVLMMWLDGNN